MASPERGAVTAEYVVGTLAATSIAAVLIHLCTDGWIFDLLWDLIRQALDPSVLRDQVKQLPRLGDR